jgi:outer membrane lipoprotein-sorting protein
VSARRRLSSALLLVLALTAGCVTALPTPRAPLSEEARRAVDLVRERWQAFSDFRGLADILVERGSRKERFTGVLLLKAPDSVRFEALSPFGQPLLIATIHDRQLVAYDAATHTATTGAATPETTARLFWLAVEPDDLVGVLAGYSVPPRNLRAATVQPPDEHGPSLEMIGALHRQRVWMDFTTGVVHRLLITGGRVEVLAVYQRLEDGSPSGIELSAQGYVSGTVRYRDVRLDTGIDTERFQLAIPAGAAVERLR